MQDVICNWRESIAQHLKSGIPDMALRNCHAIGLDSIVLGVELDESGVKQTMTRMFIAHHDRHGLDVLFRADGHYMVGVHNHRYNLTLEPVVGELINYEVMLGKPAAGHLYEFEFVSGIGGDLAIVQTGRHGMASSRHRSLCPGDCHYMEASDLHTVIVPKVGRYSAWVVVEGPDVQESCMYSPLPDPFIDSSQLYQPMAKIEAERVLDRIMEEL